MRRGGQHRGRSNRSITLSLYHLSRADARNPWRIHLHHRSHYYHLANPHLPRFTFTFTRPPFPVHDTPIRREDKCRRINLRDMRTCQTLSLTTSFRLMATRPCYYACDSASRWPSTSDPSRSRTSFLPNFVYPSEKRIPGRKKESRLREPIVMIIPRERKRRLTIFGTSIIKNFRGSFSLSLSLESRVDGRGREKDRDAFLLLFLLLLLRS